MAARVSTATRQLVDEIAASLRAHANPVRSAGERAYLKSDLEFIGTGVPVIRSVTRAFSQQHALDHDALVALVRALWARRVHELRGVAIVLLTSQAVLLSASDFALVEELLRASGTWAYVDALATGVAGPLVEGYPELHRDLDRWAEDHDFWVRRAAMLALLLPIRRGGGDFDRFARYADAMLEQREFFIRKAIGWVLREASKRRPELVAEWLLPRAGRASGVTVREAVKYLDARWRERILAEQRPARPGRASRGA